MNAETTTTLPANPVVETRDDPTVFRPAAQVIEEAEQVRLFLDLPGVAEGDLDITLEQNVLTVSGRQASCEVEGHRPVRTEYDSGLFRRTFTTSRVIDPEGIRATLKNGVLELELRKRKETLPRQIPVRTET